MKKSKILWILGEENPNTDTTYKVIKYVLDYHGIEYASYLSEFQAKRVNTNEYLVKGFLSDFFDEIRYLIVSGTSSFVDYLFYLQEHLPTSKDKPIHAIEATKNGFKDAGNMTDQRSEKDVLVKYYFGEDTPVSYLLNMRPGAEKEPKNINLQALRRMKTCGMNIFVSYIGQEEYEEIDVPPYSSVEELVDNDRNLTLDKDGNVSFALPLWKSKNPKQQSDPNIGRLCSIANTLKHLCFQKEFMIKNHKLGLATFQGKNKLTRILNIMKSSFTIKIEEVGSFPELSFRKQEYFKLENNGEKIASIALEANLRERGLQTVFNNHAGCEKSYIITEKGQYVLLPTKDEQGQKIGISDLCSADRTIKGLFVFESERLVNKEVGHNQILSPEFIRSCYEIMKHWPGYYLEVHLVTFGDKCEKDLFYSLDKDNNEVLNMNARPILRLEPLH